MQATIRIKGYDGIEQLALGKRTVVFKARSRKLGGTGLGLAIVKHIASVHGGEVGVSSKPGAGSTFSIRLPRH